MCVFLRTDIVWQETTHWTNKLKELLQVLHIICHCISWLRKNKAAVITARRLCQTRQRDAGPSEWNGRAGSGAGRSPALGREPQSCLISTSSLKYYVTIVFLDQDFLYDKGILAIREHQRQKLACLCIQGFSGPFGQKWVVRYWHCHLSGARCKWFAYDRADVTATPSSLSPVKSRMVYLSGDGLPRLYWKKGR